MLVPLYSEINAESPRNGIWINFTHLFLRIEIRSNADSKYNNLRLSQRLSAYAVLRDTDPVFDLSNNTQACVEFSDQIQ
jgi:hypothetical protein